MVDTEKLKIELIQANAREHAALFENLLNLYFYDFAEILGNLRRNMEDGRLRVLEAVGRAV